MRNAVAVVACAICSLLFIHADDSPAVTRVATPEATFDYGDELPVTPAPLESATPEVVESTPPEVVEPVYYPARGGTPPAATSADAPILPMNEASPPVVASAAPPSAFEDVPADTPAPKAAAPMSAAPMPVGSVFPQEQPSAFDPPVQTPVYNNQASCSGPSKQQAGPQPTTYYYQQYRRGRVRRGW